eukprot:TRINITY_DN12234_c0_g1_i1.p1 TRINITY_DN12234_c0_g1~~TRINITY_DN12234_c0_g1_i1.p1  ORF type:complete len:515 (+),score=85.94 TRINITY_DN12234_c0_g1_i1:52-1596(+)
MGASACSCGDSGDSQLSVCCSGNSRTGCDAGDEPASASAPHGNSAVDPLQEAGPVAQFSSEVLGADRPAIAFTAFASASPESKLEPELEGVVAASALKSEQLDEKSAGLLKEIQRLVNVEYDMLTAFSLMQQLQEILAGTRAWVSVQGSALHQRLTSRLKEFMKGGRACFDHSGEWHLLYENAKEGQSIHARFNEVNPLLVEYRVSAQVNAPLSSAYAVANEEQLMSIWNNLVEGTPRILGTRTSHYKVVNYQMSAMAGLYKVDFLNEIRRFIDPESGCLIELVGNIEKGHPLYVEPRKGYNRPVTKFQTVWSACGKGRTVLVQTGNLKLPFSVGKWLGTKLGGIAGKYMVEGLVRNSLLSIEPNSPWQSYLETDTHGLYALLQGCESGKLSQERQPKPGNEGLKIEPFDLSDHFQDQRFSSLHAVFELKKLEEDAAPMPALAELPELAKVAVALAPAELAEPTLAKESSLQHGQGSGSGSLTQKPRKQICCCCRRRHDTNLKVAATLGAESIV